MVIYKNFVGICLIVFSIILFFSFYSYRIDDPSFLYYTSSSVPVANWCGTIGANSASFFFYLFGHAAYFVVIFFWFITFLIYARRSFLDELDRIVAYFISIFVATVYLERFYGDGGYIGASISRHMAHIMDNMIASTLIYTCSALCFVIIARTVLFHGIMLVGRSICMVMQRRNIQRVWWASAFCITTIFSGISRFFLFLYALFSGLFVEECDQSILEFEYDFFEQKDRENEPLVVPATRLDNHVQPVDLVHRAETESIEYLEKHDVHNGTMTVQHNIAYRLPHDSIFKKKSANNKHQAGTEKMRHQAVVLEEKLARFGISGKVTAIKQGPVVTLFEYQPDIDAKISKIISLEDDLGMALQAHSIRIIAPIPGRAVVGFEVSNTERLEVKLADIIQSTAYQEFTGSLPLILGENIVGEAIIADLASMPHLLLAGSTGSGKSVCLNSMLISLLYKQSPDDLRLILIDPKRLEFASYADIAHLIFPVVTQSKHAVGVLRWAVQEMERRYECLALSGVRNIHDYRLLKNNAKNSMPFIVIVIDEFADLVMTASNHIEDLIIRIAQMARAAGIHLILATQRPSVDVITGLIKANFPSRISFRVSSKTDSRIILDSSGAEKLLGRGDMLFLNAHAAKIDRVHGAYVSDDEIADITTHIRSQRVVVYHDFDIDTVSDTKDEECSEDQLYQEVLGFVRTVDEVSISLLQRRFKIGYNRSARIVDMLESQGVITTPEGSKTRKVIR
jgi:DNA segregation ATPase FtsK/SpoIIIE-like protein